MPYDPTRHHRRSIRLQGYDYSQPGAYFITIVIKNREPILGTIKEGVFYPSRFGHLARMVLTALPKRYPYLQLDEFVLMPDHVHMILVLLEEPRTRRLPTPPRHSITEVVRGFKTESARKINRKAIISLNHDVVHIGQRLLRQRNAFVDGEHQSLAWVRIGSHDEPIKGLGCATRDVDVPKVDRIETTRVDGCSHLTSL